VSFNWQFLDRWHLLAADTAAPLPLMESTTKHPAMQGAGCKDLVPNASLLPTQRA
jgi:hypothetical protein